VKSEDLVEFEIQDTGYGIPKEEQGKIFGRYIRGTNVISLGIVGTGIGLDIVKEYVELHEGRIKLESEIGRGSTFSFTIPIRNNE
jgi:signal transduction histidine kinase